MIPDKPPFALRTVIIVAVGGWVVWGLFALLVAFGFSKNGAMTVAGQIGDLFGGINALFSALAFAMVWWAGDMQRRELSLQRQDLHLQLNELKAQRDELAETRSVFKRQNFEAAFFQQLSLLREMLRNFSVGEKSGDLAVSVVKDQCVWILVGAAKNFDLPGQKSEFVAHVVEKYEKLYTITQSQYGPYFRTLYHTFKLLDHQDFDDSEKIYYANLLRAQIGEDMLVVLATNILSPFGTGFVPLIERYGVLKHCPTEGKLHCLTALLPESAFAGSSMRSR